MNIRPSSMDDLETLMRIYDTARSFMSAHGNPNQWTGGYPSEDLIRSEIEAGHCHVCETSDGRIAGTFCFITEKILRMRLSLTASGLLRAHTELSTGLLRPDLCTESPMHVSPGAGAGYTISAPTLMPTTSLCRTSFPATALSAAASSAPITVHRVLHIRNFQFFFRFINFDRFRLSPSAQDDTEQHEEHT